MEVNFVVNGEKYSTGLSCYASNLKKALPKKIKLREVDTGKKIPKIVLAIEKLLPFNVRTALSNNPLFLILRKNAIIHFTAQNFALPLFFKKYRSVVTVHDMISFEFSKKELFIGKRLSFFNKIISKINLIALKKANRIIADSEYTKKRIIKMINYPAERISVVHLGVDTKEFRPLKVKKDPFTILYVGSEMPRKNLPVLIKAFAKLKKKLPQAKLVKVGLPQWPGSRKRLKKLISKLDISDSVIFKDYSDNLALEYNKAALLVQPSTYEGFGLPVLEAMACGCPVICCNKTSLPEVGGRAVLYFNGHDIEDLTRKIYKVLTKNQLRNNLVEKGLVQSKRFSWKKTAQETIKVYNRI